MTQLEAIEVLSHAILNLQTRIIVLEKQMKKTVKVKNA